MRLLHYLPGLFRCLASGTKYAYWADPVNMDFIYVATLRREWPVPQAPQIVMTGIPLGPFSSNIAVIFRR